MKKQISNDEGAILTGMVNVNAWEIMSNQILRCWCIINHIDRDSLSWEGGVGGCVFDGVTTQLFTDIVADVKRYRDEHKELIYGKKNED